MVEERSQILNRILTRVAFIVNRVNLKIDDAIGRLGEWSVRNYGN